MTLLNNNPLFNSLITFSKNGVEIANYVQIRNAITSRYREIYGSDIDISTASADGQYIEMLCLIVNNMLQSFKSTYNNLDANTAQGHFLDVLCALTNVSRKPATHSTAMLNLTLTYPSTITVGPLGSGAMYESIEFLDKAGNIWEYKPSTVNTFNEGVAKNDIVVECTELGPIAAQSNWISSTVDSSIIFEIAQPNAAELGSFEETDSQLRARRLQSLSSSGLSVLQSLVSDVLTITGVEDIKIYNNDSDQTVDSKDGTHISPHAVYVIIRQLATAGDLTNVIGPTLYEKMTPGIHFTTPGNGGAVTNGVAREYTYSQTWEGQVVNVGITQKSRWKIASSINPTIVITIQKYTPFYDSRVVVSAFNISTAQIIGQTIIDFMNSLQLSEDAKPSIIKMKAQLADPMFKGMATFFVDSVTIDGSTDDFENEDAFYKYTSYSIVDSSETTTITII